MVVTLRARDTGSKEEEEAVITEKICAPTTPVLLGSEVTIPIYVDENVSRTGQSQQHDNYLKELLEVYRDQIVTLKLELNHKNEIISDLIQCIKVNKNASVASSNEASKLRKVLPLLSWTKALSRRIKIRLIQTTATIVRGNHRRKQPKLRKIRSCSQQ